MKVSSILAVAAALLVALMSKPVFSQDLGSGKAALEAGRYSQALKILLPLANAGNDEAQRIVGEMSYNGQGMNRSASASFAWNEVAAGRGNMIAQYNLGYLYEKGDGVAASRTEAIAWYTRAAMQGYSPAQHKLGDLYASSQREKSIYWYDLARQNGDESAIKKLSSLTTARSQEQQAAIRLSREHEKEKSRLEEQERLTELTARNNARDRANIEDASSPRLLPSAVEQMAKLQQIQRSAERYGAQLRAANSSSQSQGQSRTEVLPRAPTTSSTSVSSASRNSPAVAGNLSETAASVALAPTRQAAAKDEGRVVNQTISGTSLEEHQSKTWCQRRVPEFQNQIRDGGDKILSMGACSCRAGGALVTLSKQFTCEFPVSLRLYGANPAR